MPKILKRCLWPGSDPLYIAYHDKEWGVPQRDPRMLWEMLMLEGFQAGLAWITVLRKRDALHKAFKGFDPAKVARFGERDIARLLADSGIIRSRAKIEATIAGARIYQAMEGRGEDFAGYPWSFTGGNPHKGAGASVPASTPLSEQISKDLKKRGFKFVGPTIVYAWMQAVGIVITPRTAFGGSRCDSVTGARLGPRPSGPPLKAEQCGPEARGPRTSLFRYEPTVWPASFTTIDEPTRAPLRSKRTRKR